jgi:hypothetical protein
MTFITVKDIIDVNGDVKENAEPIIVVNQKQIRTYLITVEQGMQII